MRISVTGFLFFLAFINPWISSAQCPSSGFSAPDSVCGNSSFQLTNTGAAGNSYVWDFCPGDLSLTPTGTNLGNIGNLNGPQQMRVVKDNGKYFLFIADQASWTLRRYDFGNSLDSIPVMFNYGNFGNLLDNPIGIDVIKENGVWYALISNYSNQKIIRVDLGSSIEANVASATDLGTFGLVNPTAFKIAHDGSNYYLFVSSTPFARVDFGNSITNTPTGATLIPIPTSTFVWGFDYEYDCNQNKYVGFATDYLQSKIYTLDFGNSLANSPGFPGSVSTASGPNAITIIRDGADFHLIVSISNISNIQNFKIGSDLLATPVSIYQNQLGGINFPQSMVAYTDSSRVYAFSANIGPISISQISWPQNCSFSPNYSTDPTSVTTTSTGGGYQTISLLSTDPGSGLGNMFVDSVYVLPIPVSMFSTDAVCENNPVQFHDLSTISVGSISSWTWDFGDLSTPDFQQNPTHIFPGAGPYTVTLTTQSSPVCAGNTYSSVVTVYEIPDASFSFSNNQCQFASVAFTDLSQAFGGTTVTTWSWNFGDTTLTDSIQNPTHSYLLPGTYTVTLIVTTNSGCIDSISQTITIIPAPVADFSVESTCVGETAVFTNASAISGGGTINYEWSFGDLSTSNIENPTHNYAPTAANYDVQLIALALNGCNDTLIQTIRIADKPVPQFSWTPPIVCVGNTVTFSNTSTGSGTDTIALHVWDFGDSITSNDINPTHAYADTGSYQVTLTVMSLTNCDSSITQTISVIAAPTATFTANSVCLNLATTFNPSVTTPPGSVVDSIVWTYGDGNGFTGTSSPTHTYTNPGSYEVIMTVYNNLLCTGTFIDTVEVYPLPTANFTTSLVCSGAPTTFDGTSSVIVNDVLSSWTWDFNGLGTATDSITQFVFQNAGPYNVTLIVYSSHSCSDTIQKPIEVSASPDFDFVYNEPCLGTAANFTFIPNVSPPPSADLIWDFGDSSQSFLLNPSHVYTTVDTFLVNLTVTEDSSGCTANHIKQLVIRPLPEAGFTATGFCAEQPVTLIDTSVIATGTIVSWNWNLGIFGTSTQMNPVIVPASAGTYFFNLSVTSDFGCVGDTNGTHTVYSKPDAAVVPDPMFGAPPLSVNFINNTTGATSYFWDFDDGTFDNGTSPTHLFADTGNYAVTMIATSSQGCIDTVITNVSVVVPYLDLEVSDISYTRLQDQFKISAMITNKGFLTITSFQMREKLDQNSILTEQWQGTLLPGTQIFYNFQSSYMVNSTFNPEYYCVEALYPNDTEDDNPSNNSFCKVISSNFEIFSVYPNPFNEVLTINFNLDSDGPVDVEIYDMAGKLILDSPANTGTKGYNSITTHVNQLAKGAYAILLRFRDEEQRILAVKFK